MRGARRRRLGVGALDRLEEAVAETERGQSDEIRVWVDVVGRLLDSCFPLANEGGINPDELPNRALLW